MNLFYTVILGVPIFSTIISERIKSDDHRKAFHWCVVFLCAFLVANRKNVGVDLLNYERFYNAYLNGQGPSVQFSDFGYNLINRLFGSFGIPFPIFLFIISIITLHAFFYLLEKTVKNNEFIAAILYFLIFDIYVYSLSAVRQSISIALLLYGIVFLREKKHLLAVLFIALGCSIHWSLIAIIPLIIFAVWFKKIKVYTLILFIPLSTAAYMLLMQTSLLNRIANINYNLTLYLVYENQTLTSNSSIMWIVFGLLALIWVFVIAYFEGIEKGIIKFSTKEFLLKEINLEIEDWLVYLFFVSKIWLALRYNTALPRFQMYLYFFLPIAVAKEFNKMGNTTRFIMAIIMLIMLILSFNNNLMINYSYYGNASFGF